MWFRCYEYKENISTLDKWGGENKGSKNKIRTVCVTMKDTFEKG